MLVAREDYDKLDKYRTDLQLEVDNPLRADNVGVLKNLSIVQSQCVTRGIGSSKKALYLVELTDGRGIVDNRWFQFPLNTQYNVRTPAYPSTFYPASMNGGTTWTWATMLEDIWTRMATHIGAWPGFPAGFTTPSTPEGWWFTGVPAWRALNDILELIGLTVACDLTSATPFTLVRPGNADATFDTLTTKYDKFLEDDLEWIDLGAGRVPKTVTVLFRRRNAVYGVEETVRYDSPQWSMTTAYSVVVTAPAAFSSAVGQHYIWSDFTVRYDQNNLPLAEDVVTAAARAQSDVLDYFADVYRQTLGFMSRTYKGALPFATGSQVDVVRWFQDYGYDDWGGWRTELVRGPQPAWPDIMES